MCVDVVVPDMIGKGKGKRNAAVRNTLTATGTRVPYGITQCVTCHPAQVTFPPLPQPKLVLD